MRPDEALEAWGFRLASMLNVPAQEAGEWQRLVDKGEPLPSRRVSLHLARMGGVDTLSMAGPNFDRNWRLETVAVGSTAYECNWIRNEIDEAIYRRRFTDLDMAGLVSRDYDGDTAQREDGIWSGADGWLYSTYR